jgi:hypothetical protein
LGESHLAQWSLPFPNSYRHLSTGALTDCSQTQLGCQAKQLEAMAIGRFATRPIKYNNPPNLPQQHCRDAKGFVQNGYLLPFVRWIGDW